MAFWGIDSADERRKREELRKKKLEDQKKKTKEIRIQRKKKAEKRRAEQKRKKQTIRRQNMRKRMEEEWQKKQAESMHVFGQDGERQDSAPTLNRGLGGRAQSGYAPKDKRTGSGIKRW